MTQRKDIEKLTIPSPPMVLYSTTAPDGTIITRWADKDNDNPKDLNTGEKP